MKIYTGGIATETNSFSPFPTGLRAFKIGDEGNSLVRKVTQACEENGWQHIRGTLADAHPGSVTPKKTFETLRDKILSEVASHLPIDMVLLDVHGGMVAQGYDDPEGDLFREVRKIVGQDAVIGARLDPHSHLSDAMLHGANILCFYKENPHTDIAARGDDLLRLCLATHRKEICPVMSTFDCRMVDVFQTIREPMKSFMERVRALEGKDGVLDVSIVHGFRRADVPLMGTHVIVTTNNQPERGAQLAEALGRELFAMRGKAAAPYVKLGDAVEQAINLRGPVVLADLADNPGGGSPGDSTYILRKLFDKGERNIAVGYMVDPIALDFAIEAGEGAELDMRIGGKVCPLSGDPVDLRVTVMAILPDASMDSINLHIGPCAWLRSGQTDIVLINRRWQTYTPELFQQLGVPLAEKQVIVVKSAQHYGAYFGDVMAHDIVVDAPGVCTADWRNLPFSRVRKDIWPFVEDPWQEK